MWAAVVEEPGKLVLKQVEKPVPGKHQFLVKTLAASICNATDNHILEGIFEGGHDRYPQVLGHEICGEVVEVGEGVTDVKVGDRIGQYTSNGAFQEYVLADAAPYSYGYAKVPDGLPDDVASICEMLDGAYRGTIACAEIQPGERVLIVGCGPMGLTAIAAAKAHGARVFAVDFYENRLSMALEMGAEKVYNHAALSADDVIEAVRKDAGEIDTACVCIALDRSKDLDAYYMPVELVKPGGRITSLNVEVKKEHHNHVMNPFHMNRKNILYRHALVREGTVEDFQRGYEMVAEGKIPLEKLITHHVTLDQLPWALDMCHNHLDQCIKIVVWPRVEEK